MLGPEVERKSSPEVVTIASEVFLDSADPVEVLRLVSTAVNWPSIVLSSCSVAGQTTAPLAVGDVVREYFGVPLLWTPSVEWTCEAADLAQGIVDVRSASGVAGLADSCRMLFTAVRGKAGGTQLRLEMSYRPLGLLAWLARPLLEADNALALRLLVPKELERQGLEGQPSPTPSGGSS